MDERADEWGAGMDPVTAIVTALTVGAAAGTSDGAKDAVVALYGQLKQHLLGRFGADSTAADNLERHASNPQGHNAPLRDAVQESGAGSDPTIVELARKLLMAADPDGAQVGRYNVRVTGGVVGSIGDSAHVKQTINPASKP